MLGPNTPLVVLGQLLLADRVFLLIVGLFDIVELL
jgi:hypothetical protein